MVTTLVFYIHSEHRAAVCECVYSRGTVPNTHTGTAFDTITVVPCDQTDTKLSLSLVSLCRYVSHKATTYCISIFVVDKPAKSLFNNGWHVRTHTEWHKRLKKGISRNETFTNQENIKALKCCSKSEQLLPCHNFQPLFSVTIFCKHTCYEWTAVYRQTHKELKHLNSISMNQQWKKVCS